MYKCWNRRNFLHKNLRLILYIPCNMWPNLMWSLLTARFKTFTFTLFMLGKLIWHESSVYCVFSSTRCEEVFFLFHLKREFVFDAWQNMNKCAHSITYVKASDNWCRCYNIFVVFDDVVVVVVVVVAKYMQIEYFSFSLHFVLVFNLNSFSFFSADLQAIYNSGLENMVTCMWNTKSHNSLSLSI